MAQTLETEAELDGEEESSGKGRMRRVVLLVAVLLAIGAGAFWLLAGGGDADAEAEPEEGAVLEIPDLTANLAGDQMRYVRVSMAAVLRADAEAGRVEQRFPVLRDAALSELATMTADEVRSAEGLDELRTRMTAHAQETYPDGEVLRILVTELVVQ